MAAHALERDPQHRSAPPPRRLEALHPLQDRRRPSGRSSRRRSGRRPGTAPGRRTPAAVGSWVTITMLCPNSSTERRRNRRISALERESRLPVGSSANTIAGRLTRARAQATRCCWPPDSWLGRWDKPVAQADGVDHGVEPLLVDLAPGDVERQGDVLPGGERRHEVERLEDEAEPVAPQPGQRRVLQPARAADPSMTTSPEVGVSSAAMQCIRVDLPEPDGPMIAVSRPRSKSTLTPVERDHGGLTRCRTPSSGRTARAIGSPVRRVTDGHDVLLQSSLVDARRPSSKLRLISMPEQ